MKGIAGESESCDRSAVGITAIVGRPVAGPAALWRYIPKHQPHRFTWCDPGAAATLAERHHRQALKFFDAQIGISLTGEFETPVAMPQQLGTQPLVRTQTIQCKSRADQFLIGRWNAGKPTIEISQ